MSLIDEVRHILSNISWAPGETAQEKFKEVKSTTVKNAILRLSKAGLMTGENARLYVDDLIKSHAAGSLSKAYVELHQLHLFSGEGGAHFRELLRGHVYPSSLADAFKILSTGGVLPSEMGSFCCDILARCGYPIVVAEIVVLLNKQEMLTKEIVKRLYSRTNLQHLLLSIKNLKEAGLLVGDRAPVYLENMLLDEKNPQHLANALIFLHRLGGWQDSYFDLLTQAKFPIEPFADIFKVFSEVSSLGGDSGLKYLDFLLSYSDKEVSLTLRYLALSRLHSSQLLLGERGQGYCDIIFAHKVPHSVALALVELHGAGFTEDRLTKLIHRVIEHDTPALVSGVAVALERCHLFTEENYLKVMNHANPTHLKRILSLLSTTGLLEGLDGLFNLNELLIHPKLDELADGLDLLRHLKTTPTEMLALRSNRSVLLAHPRPKQVFHALYVLNARNLLPDWLITPLLKSDDLTRADSSIMALNKAGLLNEINFMGMERLPTQPDFLVMMQLFSRTPFFQDEGAQGRLDAMLNHPNILLDPVVTREGWLRLPTRLRSDPHVLADITAIAQDHLEDPVAGRVAVVAYIAAQLQLKDKLALELFTNHQITHTASIHRSVSKSAARLKARYAPLSSTQQLMFDQYLSVKDWLVSRPDDSEKEKAAKRFFDTLRGAMGLYQDPESKVELLVLLIYVWMAIHDESQRRGTLEDALSCLMDAMYEIQRGGNINQYGVDMGGPDVPICHSGAFNRLVATLVKIHPDVQIVFISHEIASLKFQVVVEEEAMGYLTMLAESGDEGQHQQFKQFVDGIKPDEGLPEELWALISVGVADRMFEEFGSLYPAGRASPEFLAFIAAGESVSIQPRNVTQLAELSARFMPAVVDSQELLFEPFDPNSFFNPNFNPNSRRGPDEDPEPESEAKRMRF